MNIGGVISWLDNHYGAVSAILTLVLTVVTSVYVVLTAKLLKEHREARKELHRPIVSITTVLHESLMHILNLRIENVGNGAARNLTFKVQEPKMPDGVTQLSRIGFFQNGLRYLGPRRRIETFLASSIGNLEKLREKTIQIEVEYQDEGGRKHNERFEIGFSDLENVSRVGDPPLHTIAKKIEELASIANRVASGMNKPRIVSYSPDEAHQADRASDLYVLLYHLDEEKLAEIERIVGSKFKKAFRGETDVPDGGGEG